ncbi:MAG: hypothetical protein LBV18_03950 [Alistipes sp.]|jgi:hypothetical protein|nr:hypothetical protein [Alistipes sp.]
MNTELKLGDYVRSRVSHFAGMLTATSQHLYGVPQGQVTLTTPVDGEVKYEWFPITELEPAE